MRPCRRSDWSPAPPTKPEHWLFVTTGCWLLLILSSSPTLRGEDGHLRAKWWNEGWQKRLVIVPEATEEELSSRSAVVDFETPEELSADGRELRATDADGNLLPLNVHFIEKGGQSRVEALLNENSRPLLLYYVNAQARELLYYQEERPKAAAKVESRQKKGCSLNIDFTYSQEGDRIIFENRSTDLVSKIATHQWSFGGGAFSDQPDPAHAFPSPGLYTVSLHCTNEAGQDDSRQRTVAFRALQNLEGLETAEPLRLTRAMSWEGDPSFAPDGSRIAFVSDRSGRSEIYTMRPDGSDVMLVTQWAEIPELPSNRGYPYRSHSPTWSPDGRWIVFSSNHGSPSDDLWIAQAHGGEPKRLTPHRVTSNEQHPRWSPDGSWIAFTSDAGELQNIWVKPVAGGAAHRLTSHKAASYPAWYPGSTRVAFLSSEGTSPTYACLWQAELRSGVDEAITQKDGGKYGPFSWSPSGAYIAYARHVGGGYGALQGNAIFLLDVHSKESHQLTPLESHCDSPSWSPDGSTIVFRRMERRTGNSDISSVKLTPRTWPVKARAAAVEVEVETENGAERLYREAGDHLENRRQYGKAVEMFLNVARERPEHALAPEALGQAALSATLGVHDFGRAASICRELVERYPHSPQARQAMFLEGLCYQQLLRHEKLTTVKLAGRRTAERSVPREYFLRCVDILKALGYSIVDEEEPSSPPKTDRRTGRDLDVSLSRDFFYRSDDKLVAQVWTGLPDETLNREPLHVSLVRPATGEILQSVRVEPPVARESAAPFKLAGLQPGLWHAKDYAVQARIGDTRAEARFGVLPEPRESRPSVRVVEATNGLLVDGRPVFLIGADNWKSAAKNGCNAALGMPTGSVLDQLWDAGLYAIATAPPFNPDDWSMFNNPNAVRHGTEPKLEAYKVAAARYVSHPALIGWLVLDEPRGRLTPSAFTQASDGFRFFAEVEHILTQQKSHRLVGVSLSGKWLEKLGLFAPLSNLLFVPREELARLPERTDEGRLICARVPAKPPINFVEAASRARDLDYPRWAAWQSILNGARGVWFEEVGPSMRQLAAELRFFSPALADLRPLEAKPSKNCLSAQLQVGGRSHVVVCGRDEGTDTIDAEVPIPDGFSRGREMTTGKAIAFRDSLLKIELAPFAVQVVELAK